MTLKTCIPVVAALLVVSVAGSKSSWGGPAVTADADDHRGKLEHLTLHEIVVTDTPVGTAAVTAVDIRTIEKGRNLNIPDAVKDEPGITLQRRASVGDTADIVAIRGLSGNRLTLNLNGRPANAAGVVGGHYIDWGTIPLDNVERIEILRGGSSVRYGNNALGGVINVITKAPTSEPSFTLYQNIGVGEELDYVTNTRLTHAWKVGPFGYSLAGSFQKADEFLWNNDFEGRNLNLATEIEMAFGGRLSLGLQYANARRGFIRQNRQSSNPTDPGFDRPRDPDYPLAFGETFNPYSGTAFIPGPGAHWEKTKYYLDLGYRQPLGDAMVEVKIYKNHEDRKENNYSAAGMVPGYGNGRLVLERTVESDRSYGGRIEVTKPLGERHELLLGVDHQVLAYGDVDLDYIDTVYNSFNWFGPPATGFEPSQKAVTWGYYVQDTWQLSDRFLLTAGVRYDRYENRAINGSTLPDLEDHAITPKLTGTFELTPADTITVSLYQALRTPGLPETYWWASGATAGNPVLKPEKNTAAELIAQHRFHGRGFLRLSAYYYEIDNYIMFRNDPDWRGVYNLDQAVIYGASCEGRYDINDTVSLRGSIACQKSRKQGDTFDSAGLSDELDYLPEIKAGAGLELRLPGAALFNADLRYVGERHAIYAYSKGFKQAGFELVDLDAYATVDLAVRVPFARYGEVGLYVENLFDTAYEERYGYPLSGRLIGASLKLTF